MPIMIPINVQDMPVIPMFNMDEYMSRVSRYASELWDTMSREERSISSRKRGLTTDCELEKALAGRPEYCSVSHDDMSQLSKEDYSLFARKHNAMKGVEMKMACFMPS